MPALLVLGPLGVARHRCPGREVWTNSHRVIVQDRTRSRESVHFVFISKNVPWHRRRSKEGEENEVNGKNPDCNLQISFERKRDCLAGGRKERRQLDR